MGLFDKMREPIFLKESNNAQNQLERLKELEPKLNTDGKKRIRQDIRMLEYGIAGEKNIAFELMNSHFPMYILHDVYIESDGLTAQIDYLVFTRKICFVIECKNLVGNIEINTSGDFIRTTEFRGKKKKEGIYSPITQNQRHLELIKKIKMDNKNFILRAVLEKSFESFYNSIVVLANQKTILNAKYAKKNIKNQVIRADQLVKHIKDTCARSKAEGDSDAQLLKWAESALKLHIEKEHNYTKKYDQYMIEEQANPVVTKPQNESGKETLSNLVESESEAIPISNELSIKSQEVAGSIEDLPVYKELREFRLLRSREEKVKAYFIFNNKQMQDIVFVN